MCHLHCAFCVLLNLLDLFVHHQISLTARAPFQYKDAVLSYSYGHFHVEGQRVSRTTFIEHGFAYIDNMVSFKFNKKEQKEDYYKQYKTKERIVDQRADAVTNENR